MMTPATLRRATLAAMQREKMTNNYTEQNQPAKIKHREVVCTRWPSSKRVDKLDKLSEAEIDTDNKINATWTINYGLTTGVMTSCTVSSGTGITSSTSDCRKIPVGCLGEERFFVQHWEDKYRVVDQYHHKQPSVFDTLEGAVRYCQMSNNFNGDIPKANERKMARYYVERRGTIWYVVDREPSKTDHRDWVKWYDTEGEADQYCRYLNIGSTTPPGDDRFWREHHGDWYVYDRQGTNDDYRLNWVRCVAQEKEAIRICNELNWADKNELNEKRKAAYTDGALNPYTGTINPPGTSKEPDAIEFAKEIAARRKVK